MPKPGEKCTKSGQYKVQGESREITMIEGNIFPPSPDGKDVTYILVDATKHKK
ncbi:hypothetical protein [Brachyspira pilosicoli]|uniref:hypothetical protein n=1 Tax=Brachyspira pilosicoli TaxID=52584 RepID=UPI0018DFC616|nr:hypothetical protein [Brachyspira pilosicoli]